VSSAASDASLIAQDEAARRDALDIARSIVVQAPAGSGKTTILTQRYLKLLGSVDDAEEVLAITFTRKATGELRTRVLAALAGRLDIRSPADQLTLDLARAALARHAELLSQPSRLRIMTIDAWHMYLASRLPVTARSNVSLRLAETPTALYLQAAREAIAVGEEDPSVASAIHAVLERLDNQWHKLEQLIASMLAVRNVWLPVLLDHAPEELTRKIQDSLARIAERTLTEAAAVLGAQSVIEARETLVQRIRWLQSENLPLPEAFAPWSRDSGALSASAADLPRWQGLTHLLLTSEDAWRKPDGIDRRLGFDPSDKAAKKGFSEWLTTLSAKPNALDALLGIRALPAATLDAADSRALQELGTMLQLAAQMLNVLFAEQGQCDYLAVAGAARQALTENGQPTDLAERLGVSLKHILVDEFQDTSYDQCELLRTMTADWSPGDGRTLFVVGDPMQSIYQFRNAEVGLFLDVRERGIGAVKLRPLSLRRNFRSARNLVDHANTTFAAVFPPADDRSLGAVTHLASSPSRDDLGEGVVNLHRVAADDEQAEAGHFVEIVRRLRAQRPNDTIAILVSSRPHAGALCDALQAASIPFSGVEFTPLLDTPIVRDLEALTRALLHLGDRASWLAVARAPWAGLTLPDLTALAAAGPNSTLLEQLAAAGEASRLSAQGRVRAKRLHEISSVSLAERGKRPLAEWVESTWLKLGGAAACEHESDLADAAAFFETLATLDRVGVDGVKSSLESLLARLYAAPSSHANDSVVVTTIHQAKGLEFDHVLLPGIGRRQPADAAQLLEWLDLPSAGAQPDLLIAPRELPGEQSSSLKRFIRHLRKRRRSLESARLLYVAMTRAKRSLHVALHTKAQSGDPSRAAPQPNSLLQTLWPAVAGIMDTLPSITDGAKPNGATRSTSRPMHRLRRLEAGYQLPQPPPDAVRAPLVLASIEDLLEYRWAGETARHIGTVVHRSLERLAKFGLAPPSDVLPADAERLRGELASLGVAPESLTKAAEQAAHAIANTLADTRGRWILDAGHVGAYSELALSGLEGQRIVNGVIDRTFVDRDGVRWIIDFKTSPHEGGALEFFLDEQVRRYQPQLARYARLIQLLGPEPVRAGLYFPLLQAWRECPLD
jgi:ATP-dependent exoDNAse (exonuclease V) beta subunit